MKENRKHSYLTDLKQLSYNICALAQRENGGKNESIYDNRKGQRNQDTNICIGKKISCSRNRIKKQRKRIYRAI